MKLSPPQLELSPTANKKRWSKDQPRRNTLLDAYEYYQKKSPDSFIEKLQIQYFGEKELNESQGNKQKFRYGPRRIENTQKNWHWYYSFWERRDVEGNTEMGLKILKDVQSHYEVISTLD